MNEIYKNGLEPFGRFYGNYYGIVVSVEDPDKVGRILVRIPEVKGLKALPVWAYPKGQYAGLGYGFQCLPEEEELVVITFRQGRPESPQWEHAHWGEGQKPSDFYSTHIKGFITPRKIKVLIDDQQEFVHIQLPSGSLINIDKDKVSLSSNEIHFNSEDKDEPFLKGTTTEELLNTLIGYIEDLCTGIVSDAQGSLAPIAPQTIAKAVDMLIKIQLLRPTVKNIKSSSIFGS